MTNEEFNELFRKRTKKFAIAILKFIASLPFDSATKVISYQLGKSGTSVGSNHRAFCRARSKNERFAKICIDVEEADESLFWLEVCDEADYGDKKVIRELSQESLEILKVTGTIKNSMFPDH